MSKYINYFSENNIQDWAVNTLNAQELEQFNSVFLLNNSLWQNYQTDGLISVVPIFESVYIAELNQSIDIQVGEEIVLSPGVTADQLKLYPGYDYWLDRYHSETQQPFPPFVTN